MSSAITSKRIATTRLWATSSKWGPVVTVLIAALILGIALVQTGTISARSTESRTAPAVETLTSPCRHQMTTSSPGPACDAVPAADVATGYDLGRPHGFVHRQSRAGCEVLPKRGRICSGR
jgi:hypothetical protein